VNLTANESFDHLRAEMIENYFTRLFAVAVVIILFTTTHEAFCQPRSSTGYRLTIYADEGTDKLEVFGHVFIGLANGSNTLYKGWNPSNHVEDESKRIANCEWDVRKTYNITKSGYDKAVQVMNDWNNDKFRIYNVVRPGYHCGDFAEAVAKAAGVQVNLSWQLTGRNRPGLFGEYLRDQGGEVAGATYYVHRLVDTGIAVVAGDRILVRASGTVSFGESVGSGGPEGILWVRALLPLPIPVDPHLSYVPDMLHGALIGRIKTAKTVGLGDWFYIGREKETHANSSGILQLNVNDKFPNDNNGDFEVHVKICKEH